MPKVKPSRRYWPKQTARKTPPASNSVSASASALSSSSSSGGPPSPPAPPEYEVDAIVSHRMRNGHTEYLLKWKGLPESENSWEPRSHLSCRELLREYTRKPRELAKSFLN